MLKMGIPPGAVQNALKKEGKDVNIVDMDPSKSYASQAKGKDATDKKDPGPPLKDDPEFAKFFKVRLYFIYNACLLLSIILDN